MRPPIDVQRFDGALAAGGLGVSLREPVRSMDQSRGRVMMGWKGASSSYGGWPL